MQQLQQFFQQATVLPRFVVFEGIDKSGKSTQVKKLKEFLTARHFSCWQTAEPTQTPIGKLIRHYLATETQPNEEYLATLFALDRAEHLYRNGEAKTLGGIIELCKKGSWCLCDRYLFSSLAYQTENSSLESVLVRNQSFVLPSIIIFLHLEEGELKKRLQKSQKKERYETLETLMRVQKRYETIFSQLPENRIQLLSLKASDREEEIAEKIQKLFKQQGENQ